MQIYVHTRMNDHKSAFMRVHNALVHISPIRKDAYVPKKLVLPISLVKYRNIHIGNRLNKLY